MLNTFAFWFFAFLVAILLIGKLTIGREALGFMAFCGALFMGWFTHWHWPFFWPLLVAGLAATASTTPFNRKASTPEEIKQAEAAIEREQERMRRSGGVGPLEG